MVPPPKPQIFHHHALCPLRTVATFIYIFVIEAISLYTIWVLFFSWRWICRFLIYLYQIYSVLSLSRLEEICYVYLLKRKEK